ESTDTEKDENRKNDGDSSVGESDDTDIAARTENRVPWLAELLSTYPGSPRGGIETRGLYSAFAH
ncbi:MAG TPA: hypothetical protein DDZ51_08685, partial [Planctomycetaceae bacterium]|nr:hypothetical protein [Planctomycetaceae bacterium]